MSLKISIEEYLYCNQHPCESLWKYVNKNRNEGYFNDVNIKVADECFPANRMVLSCVSRVFERMFKVEMQDPYEKTVEVKEVDKKSMEILIDYIYNGQIFLNKENVMNLLAAANYLQVEDVKQLCYEYLNSILSTDTWFAMYSASAVFNDEYLKHHLHQYLICNFDEISLSANFKELSKADLTTFVSNLDRIEIEETLVYQLLIIWVKFDEDNRKTELPDLLRYVAFENLSEKFCSEVISREDLITNNFECMKVVFQGFAQNFVKRKEKYKLIGFGNQNYCELFHLNRQVMQNNRIPNLPIPLANFRLLQLNSVVFCFGRELKNTFLNKSYKIDLKKDKQWYEIASPDEAVEYLSASVFNDTLVVTGGYERYTASVEVYCSALNNWHKIARLKTARSHVELVNCEGYLYALGGIDDYDFNLSSVERLSAFDSKWEFVQSMLTPRQGHAVVSFKNSIYVFGGKINFEKLKSVEKYDPTVDKWQYVRDMSTARSNLAACVMNGMIYIACGFDASGKFVKIIECYDPLEDVWSVIGETDVECLGSSLLAI